MVSENHKNLKEFESNFDNSSDLRKVPSSNHDSNNNRNSNSGNSNGNSNGISNRKGSESSSMNDNCNNSNSSKNDQSMSDNYNISNDSNSNNSNNSGSSDISDKLQRYKNIDEKNLTPAMRQYKALKLKYPDCIIMFRMGDFYEMFYDDAVTASRVLEITLTSRGKGDKKAPLAGIPYHSLTLYLKRFVKKGYKVAIVEQLEDPKKAKGRLVKRDVIKIITPGTILDGDLIDSKENNYLMSLYAFGNNISLVLCDISTGEVLVSKVDSIEDFRSEVKKYSPKECIVPESLRINDEIMRIMKDEGIYVSLKDDVLFSKDFSKKKVLNYFTRESLSSYGIELDESDSVNTIRSLGAMFSYLEENERGTLKQIESIKKINVKDYMMLDYSTINNLELIENIVDRKKEGTLFSVVNRCKTPMGYRLMYKWILRPLVNVEEINRRLNSVEEFVNRLETKQIYDFLGNVKDIERISSKIAYKSVNPRELVALSNSIVFVNLIINRLGEFKSEMIREISRMSNLSKLSDMINKAIAENPPVKINEGGFIREGYSKDLDDLREVKKDAKMLLRNLESEERRRTGINNLKIGYNSVFGYYIQVSKNKISLVPNDYVQKQTLVSGNRYVTQRLKELEDKILGADERIVELERQLYDSLLDEVSKYVRELQDISQKIAILDCLISFAIVARENNYCKPTIDESGEIEIINGRHAVVERKQDNFIPNDVKMKNGEIIILTGPNMAGKSTYMRQTCLIIIMAQMGCFVPADSARIGIVDKIFSRVGAYDDISHGQSTFMVEMRETANILKNATNKSFIILDEVGRGTSTYDGISIAWAVVEYIYNKIKAKTIFATHYHFLNNLENEYENISNYHMLIKEKGEEIIFLRKIAKGGTDKSYGIEVAKLSGLPITVINDARKIQNQLLSSVDTKFKANKNDIQATLDFFK
ncbi:MAG: DNA mismatch repair protein MutS [Nitrospiraceae bacterium]|nr:DNA mismatch repair protein MutS [Nitrospiraceae bacterium]